MRVSPLKYWAVLLLSTVICASFPRIVTAQEALELFSQPKIFPITGIEFGLKKLNLTYVFTGNADVQAPVAGGTFRWTNLYQGSVFRTSTTAVRDDQAAQLSYEMPISGGLNAIARGSWIYSADSRNVGLSSMQRLNGVAGVKYAPDPNWDVETFGGIESTTQLGSQATGPIVGAQANLYSLNVEDWGLSGRALADWHRLDAERTNSDVDLRASVNRFLFDGSNIALGAQYTSLNRQYFTTVEGGVTPLAVEGRDEDRFSMNAEVFYNASTWIGLGFTGYLETNAIGRSYNQAVPGVALTAADRRLNEFVLDMEGRVILTGQTTGLTLGASIYSRDEANTASPLHSITDEELENLRSQEFQRDNQTSRNRFFIRGTWRPTTRDTFGVEWTSWLLRYDTPSDQNDDDRDELQAIATIRYARRMSDILTVGVALSGQYVHTVFLKASRSSLNNEANILRLSPFVTITGDVVHMQPRLEVLANYVVYDFEGEGAAVSSYGFRQLSYRDSIRVFLTNKLRLEAPLLVRYFERSTLLWSDFAEIPQTGNLEYLIRLLLFSRPNSSWDVGAGVRLYNLEQRSIQNVGGLPSLLGGVSSYAPEVVVRFNGLGNSTLQLTGWYEFQSPVNSVKREIANLQLTAFVNL